MGVTAFAAGLDADFPDRALGEASMSAGARSSNKLGCAARLETAGFFDMRARIVATAHAGIRADSADGADGTNGRLGAEVSDEYD